MNIMRAAEWYPTMAPLDKPENHGSAYAVSLTIRVHNKATDIRGIEL